MHCEPQKSSEALRKLRPAGRSAERAGPCDSCILRPASARTGPSESARRSSTRRRLLPGISPQTVQPGGGPPAARLQASAGMTRAGTGAFRSTARSCSSSTTFRQPAAPSSPAARSACFTRRGATQKPCRSSSSTTGRTSAMCPVRFAARRTPSVPTTLRPRAAATRRPARSSTKRRSARISTARLSASLSPAPRFARSTSGAIGCARRRSTIHGAAARSGGSPAPRRGVRSAPRTWCGGAGVRRSAERR